MKICHVVYIPRLSGAEILVRDLALKHNFLGHQVAILSVAPPEKSFFTDMKQLQDAGVWLGFPQQQLGKLKRILFLSAEIAKFKPDIIIAHSVIPSAYTRIAASFLARIPVISVLHDASQDDYASGWLRIFEKWLIPQPSCIVALTKTAANNYRKRIRSNTEIKIIPNGINLDKFVEALSSRNKVRKEVYNVNESDKLFLQIGRFNCIKQQYLSLQAFIKGVSEHKISGKIAFVGLIEDIDLEQTLKKIALESGLEDRILFLGPRADVPELLAGADIFLMPSKCEANSIGFIEALVSGVTIIASDIIPFQYGLEFPGVTLLQPENIDLFAKTVSAAITLAKEERWERNLEAYSIEKTSQAYLKVFGSILAVI